VTVEILDSREEFLSALKGLTDPEEKREAITSTFYRKFLGIVKESGAKIFFRVRSLLMLMRP
jgi:GMP synthase (glutamine-hydrolysing)